MTECPRCGGRFECWCAEDAAYFEDDDHGPPKAPPKTPVDAGAAVERIADKMAKAAKEAVE